MRDALVVGVNWFAVLQADFPHYFDKALPMSACVRCADLPLQEDGSHDFSALFAADAASAKKS